MKTFNTREEAAVWLIQNPGREVEASNGHLYTWLNGGLMMKNPLLVGASWMRTTFIEPYVTYTEVPLPEPEKTLEEKVDDLSLNAFGYNPSAQHAAFYAGLIRLAVEEAKKEGGK